MDELQSNVRLLLSRIDNIDGNISKIDNRLVVLAERLTTEIKAANNRIDDIEKSQTFISSEHDKFKKQQEYVINRDIARENENKLLLDKIKALESKFENERASRNTSEQYDRSSFQVKILGVPQQEGEEEKTVGSNPITEKVITNIVKAAGIQDFDISQIDVCHRIPPRKTDSGVDATPSIIARFVKKNDRLKFYAQRSLLYSIEPDEEYLDERGAVIEFKKRRKPSDSEVTFRNNKRGNEHYILMVESLTSYNGELLDLAKKKAKPLGYTYPGYSMNGQIRVKKSKDGKFIPIVCKADLDKIA